MTSKTAMIADLRLKKTQARNELDGILETSRKFGRDLSGGERARFDAKEAEVRAFNDRIEELEAQIRMDEASGPMARKYAPPSRFGEGVTRNEPTYRRDGQHSYFRDLYQVRGGNADAADRLRRNNEERAISTTTGAGGEFAPPMWLEDQFIAYARPGRVTANICPTQDLPPGVDVINVPKINSGTTVAAQSSQNTAISQTDITTTSIAAPVVTLAGGQTVSLQLLEQSPLNIDDVVLRDLAADYAKQIDSQVLFGTGSGGQLTGITTLSGTTSVTYTSASPALTGAGNLYGKIASAIQSIHSTRFMPPDAIIMHPRRWAWCEAQVDSANRPMVLPTANAPWNAVGVQLHSEAQGLVGEMLGLPVYLDSLIPTNLGAGTNQDEIIVARMADTMLFESQIRAEAFQQTFANNLSVFVRLYNYVSFVTSRYAPSIAVIGGTGLVTPTF